MHNQKQNGSFTGLCSVTWWLCSLTTYGMWLKAVQMSQSFIKSSLFIIPYSNKTNLLLITLKWTWYIWWLQNQILTITTHITDLPTVAEASADPGCCGIISIELDLHSSMWLPAKSFKDSETKRPQTATFHLFSVHLQRHTSHFYP